MKKFIPTKYQVARIQTAFILDDIEYIKLNIKTVNVFNGYDLYFYRKYDKNIWYYVVKNGSYTALEYLISIKCITNIYANISVTTNFEKLINIVNNLDEHQYKLLYIDSYESFIRYIIVALCNIKEFDKLIDISKVVDKNRFDIDVYLEEMRYIYTNEPKAINFIRSMKLKEIDNIV